MPSPKWPPTITFHRPSGQARVRHKGRDYYLGPYGSPEAKKEYAALVTRLAGGAPPPTPAGDQPKRWTVAEGVARWYAERAPRYDPEGQQVAVIAHALGPLLELFGRLPLADFDELRLDEVREAMIARKWCASVIVDRVGRLRGLFRWFERKRLAPPGTVERLGLLEGLSPSDVRVPRRPRRRPCTWDDLDLVASHSPASVAGILRLMWWCGCRTGEARRMTAGEVERVGEVWLWRPARHKTAHLGHERVIVLGPNAREVIGTRLDDRPPDELVWPAIMGGGGRSPRTRGPGCYTRGSLGRAVRRSAERAGVTGFEPYQARHAFRLRVGRSEGLEQARAALGHSSVSQTAEYASQRDLALAVEVARRMG